MHLTGCTSNRYESHRCASYRDVRASLAGREYDRRVSYRGVHLIGRASHRAASLTGMHLMGAHLVGMHLLQACIS